MKKIIKRAALVAAASAASIGLIAGPQGTASAWPSGILAAHTSRAASYMFQYGTGTIQTTVRCTTTSGGAGNVYRTGPKVGRGVWSNAFCPTGYYRNGSSYILTN